MKGSGTGQGLDFASKAFGRGERSNRDRDGLVLEDAAVDEVFRVTQRERETIPEQERDVDSSDADGSAQMRGDAEM